MSNRKYTTQSSLSPSDLRLQYLMYACYYYYRAATQDETLVSAINRISATKAAEELRRRGLPLPTPEEVRAYAVAKWPADRLHQ